MAKRRYLKLHSIEPNTFKSGANIVLRHNTGDTRYRWVLKREDISWLKHALDTFQEEEATVNEILEHEADNPTEFEPSEIDAALQGKSVKNA